MDDLDDLLRRTMKSLDDQVPAGYFEDLPSRTLARLEGASMEIETERSAASSASGVPREEDSGLHDIRNLAASTKMRLSSQRIPSPEMDDDFIASSSGGWKAVALPEPARMISIEAPESAPKKEKRQAKPVAKPAVEPVRAVPAPEVATPISVAAKRPAAPARKRGGVLAIAGVGLAAAAAIAIFIGTQNKGADRAESPAMERAKETAPPLQQGVGGAAPTGQAQIATDRGTDTNSGAVKGSGSDSVEGAGAPQLADAGVAVDSKLDTKVETPTSKIEIGKKPPVPVIKSPSKKKSVDVPDGKTVKGKVDDDVKKPDAPPDKGKPTKTGNDFDDLLKEAGVKDKKDDGPKLDKKALSADDFKKGMAAINAKASGCYQGTQGTAAVRVSVAPSGHVARVVVSGTFANTPTGNCVVAAVQGASFPAWDGPQQSFGYSFLLSE